MELETTDEAQKSRLILLHRLRIPHGVIRHSQLASAPFHEQRSQADNLDGDIEEFAKPNF